MLGIFKKRGVKQDNSQVVSKNIAKKREAVYEAIKHHPYPINGLALARLMKTDSASVTPRISELMKRGRVKVAYNKVGLDGKHRNFYVVDKDFES